MVKKWKPERTLVLPIPSDNLEDDIRDIIWQYPELKDKVFSVKLQITLYKELD